MNHDQNGSQLMANLFEYIYYCFNLLLHAGSWSNDDDGDGLEVGEQGVQQLDDKDSTNDSACSKASATHDRCEELNAT